MVVLFHHITKTSGTSLIAELKKQLGSTCDTARYDFEVNDQVLEEGRFEFYHGHYSFEMSKSIREQFSDCFAFTFIRNPIARVLSQYYNWTDQDRVYREFEVIKQRGQDRDFINDDMKIFEREIFNMSLSDFIESDLDKIKATVDNNQVRYLSSSNTYTESKELALSEAMINVSTFFDFVGISEIYDRSLRILETKINLEPMTLNSRREENVNVIGKDGERYHISEKDYQSLVYMNLYDLALYDYTLGLFFERYNLLVSEDAEGLLRKAASSSVIITS